MWDKGYSNEKVLHFLEDFDVALQKDDYFKKAVDRNDNEFFYPSLYFFHKNIYTILLQHADQELSLQELIALHEKLEHVFDNVY